MAGWAWSNRLKGKEKSCLWPAAAARTRGFWPLPTPASLTAGLAGRPTAATSLRWIPDGTRPTSLRLWQRLVP